MKPLLILIITVILSLFVDFVVHYLPIMPFYKGYIDGFMIPVIVQLVVLLVVSSK